MANPVKTGDAKLWVYRHNRDHDCQAAETLVFFAFLRAWLSRPFCFAATVTTRANPVKTGDAKPWVYRHNSDHDCQVAENVFLLPCLSGTPLALHLLLRRRLL
jgi:hypothetical protein